MIGVGILLVIGIKILVVIVVAIFFVIGIELLVWYGVVSFAMEWRIETTQTVVFRARENN